MKKIGSLLLAALVLALALFNVLTQTQETEPKNSAVDSQQLEEVTEDKETAEAEEIGETEETEEAEETSVVYGGAYTAPDEVAQYLHLFEELPPNFVTKKEAGKQGWSAGKDLSKMLPGCSIGGDKFGNLEGLLPDKSGRQYYECDVNYTGGSRGAERLVFSSDGLIYYTEDHYESFTKLYDGWAQKDGFYRGNGAKH